MQLLLGLELSERSPAMARRERLFLLSLSIYYKMSGYGWLTESSLLPKKSKPIGNDDHSSLFALKAVLQREKEKVTSGQARKVFAVKKQQGTAKNTGVEQRARRDEQQQEKKVLEGSKMLHLKEKVYDSLESSKQNVGKLLVDFTAKTLLQQQDQEEHEKMRQQFYAGKLQEIHQQREEMGISEGLGERDVRQRLAWQRQILGKLRGQEQERQKVQQVFDRRLLVEQKQALEAVIKQMSEQGKRLQQVRRRREEMQEQRIRKLKKLNILPNSHTQTQPKDGQSVPKVIADA